MNKRAASFWMDVVAGYIDVQDEQSVAGYAAAAGVTSHALRWWLAELTAGVSGRRVWAPRGSPERFGMSMAA